MRFVKSIIKFPVIIGLIFASSLLAQSVPSAFTKARAERDAAMKSNDANVYGRYTIDDFVVVMPDGGMQTKADRMALMAKAPKPAQSTPAPEQPASARDEKIIPVGSDTIILHWIAPIQGKDARFTEVWVKGSAGWKVAGAHVSMIQQKP